jgi:hypothetical protein
MSLFEQDTWALSVTLRHAARAVVEASQRYTVVVSDQQPDPRLLAQALDQLVDILNGTEADAASRHLSPEDIGRLGEYGLSLLGDLTTWTEVLGLTPQQRDLDTAAVSLALWTAQRGGKLMTLEPVVNALARIANRTHDTAVLDQLSAHMGMILEATHPSIQQDLDNSNPGRPWRVLNLNRAIVATRSHSPHTMEEAFQVLLKNLPEEAPAFFRQGMEQMDALHYPARVREVMQRYFQQWSAPKLH